MGESPKQAPAKVSSVEAYISEFPPAVQEKLREMRQIIREVVPEGTVEKLSWAMPTYDLHGNLVHFAAHKGHVGFYPGADGIEAFKDRFENRKYSKGAVQFPLDQPLPKALIQEIVAFRVKQNQEAFEAKKKK